MAGLSLTVLSATLTAEAQQPARVPRIGYLGPDSPAGTATRLEAFRQGLRDLGYVEGRNIAIEYGWAEGRAEQFSPSSSWV
jgi:putative ABC transport system substrate-binding protein